MRSWEPRSRESRTSTTALNAFVEVDAERRARGRRRDRAGRRAPVRRRADRDQGQRAGRGLCMNFASKFLAGHRPGHNAYLVRRLRDAGFVVVGTTNTARVRASCRPPSRATPARRATRGTCDRTPGGSSGGSAAAVAAGMLPIAHGNDGGGSIAHPGRLLRAGRAQASARARLARAGPRRLVPGLRRRAHAHGGRDRRRCSTCSPATRSATRRGRRGRPSRTRPRCGATPAGCASP